MQGCASLPRQVNPSLSVELTLRLAIVGKPDRLLLKTARGWRCRFPEVWHTVLLYGKVPQLCAFFEQRSGVSGYLCHCSFY